MNIHIKNYFSIHIFNKFKNFNYSEFKLQIKYIFRLKIRTPIQSITLHHKLQDSYIIDTYTENSSLGSQRSLYNLQSLGRAIFIPRIADLIVYQWFIHKPQLGKLCLAANLNLANYAYLLMLRLYEVHIGTQSN